MIHTSLALIVAVCLPLLPLHAQDAQDTQIVQYAQDGWLEFDSKLGEYRALFPGKPREEHQKLKTPGNPVVNNLALLQKGEVVYLVGYADYPDELVKQNTAEKLLRTTRDGTLESLEGKLITDQDIQLDKLHPGREFQIQLKGNAIYRARVFLVKKRVYQVVLVTTNKELSVDKEAERFFSSFKLTSK
jgi:hypothetical protein